MGNTLITEGKIEIKIGRGRPLGNYICGTNYMFDSGKGL